MQDLKNLCNELDYKFKIKAFQIHIHRDGGSDKKDNHINHHTHILFDWQDKNTGKMLRLNKLAMSQIQTLVAKSLNMQRGKQGSKSVHLEVQEFKQLQEIKKLDAVIVKKKRKYHEKSNTATYH